MTLRASKANPALDTEAQASLRESCRRMFAQQWPPLKATEYSSSAERKDALWKKLAEQGLLSLGAFEHDALGFHAATIVLEEAGYAAVPSPIIDAYILNFLLSRQDRAGAKLLEDLQAGLAQPVVLHVREGFLSSGPAFEQHSEGVILNADWHLAEPAMDATHFVLAGLLPRRLVVVEVGEQVVQTAIPGPFMNDEARVTFKNAKGYLVGAVELPDESYLALRRLAVACRAAGAVKRGIAIASDYAKSRKQFGVFISSFQAIQHKLANCYLAASGVSTLGSDAAQDFDAADRSWVYRANATFAYGAEALRRAAIELQHVFGAAGYWDTHELPRHFRHVQSVFLAFGGVQAARSIIANELLSNAFPERDVAS